MKFEPKNIVLKNGKSAILRSPTADDAKQMIDYLCITSGETNFMIREPEECVIPLEQEIGFINSTLESDNSIMIACEIDGRIVGNCSLNRYGRLKLKHRATLGISIFKEYWGLGIGSAMFEELINIGKNLGLYQLELDFVEGNERGKNLYEKFSFEIVAKRPNAIRLKDGTLLAEFSMIKVL